MRTIIVTTAACIAIVATAAPSAPIPYVIDGAGVTHHGCAVTDGMLRCADGWTITDTAPDGSPW